MSQQFTFPATSLKNLLKWTCVLGVTFSLKHTAPLHSAVVYWDDNGNTAGTSTTPNGTWGTSAFWSSSSTGTSTTDDRTVTSRDDLHFSAGTTATGDYTITVNTSQQARKLNFEEGNVTFTGTGSIHLNTTTGGINFLSATTPNVVTIHTDLSVGAAIVIDTQTLSGNELILGTGTFSRGNNGTVNLRGAGTMKSTQTGLNTNDASGIIGPWFSIGTGTSTRYATFGTGNEIVQYTGATAAINAAGLTGSVSGNYDLAAGGTAPTTLSANTIRYTGASGTLALGSGGMSVNGIMNAGTGTLTLSGNTLTIGDSRELVLHNANAGMSISSVISDHSSGASGITKTGNSTLTLSGNNTYTGHTYINQGTISVAHSGALGSSAGNTYINHMGSGTQSGGLSLTNGVTISDHIFISGAGDGTDSQWGGAITTSHTGTGSNNNTITGTITLTGIYSYRFGASADTVLNLGLIQREGTSTPSTVFSASGSGVINVTQAMQLNGGNVTVHGGGWAKFSASNNQIGDTTVANTSKLILAADNALNTTKNLQVGNTSTNTNTGSGNDVGSLYLEGVNQTINALNGYENKGSGATIGTTDKRLITGDSANDSSLFVGNWNGNGSFDGVIQDGTLGGKVSFGKLGTGTQTLTGTVSNTYTGLTTVNGGMLILAKSNSAIAIAGDISIGDSTTGEDILHLSASHQIADTSQMTLAGSGTTAGIFRLNNQSETIAGINSTSGGVVENGATATGASTLTLNSSPGQNHSFAGILQHGATADATLSVTKNGGGSQAFSGASTYTGGTTVNAGTFYANNTTGSATGYGQLIVTTGATLGGTGRIELNATSRAQISGTLAPGAGAGLIESLEFSLASATGATSSGLTLSGTTLAFDLGAAGSSIASVGLSDQLLLGGTLNESSDLSFTGATNFDFGGTGSGGWYKLVDTSITSDTVWSGLLLDSSTREITGGLTFTGLGSGLTGTLYLGNGSSLGDFGDVYLQVIPEPHRALLLGLGLGAMLFQRKRRK